MPKVGQHHSAGRAAAQPPGFALHLELALLAAGGPATERASEAALALADAPAAGLAGVAEKAALLARLTERLPVGPGPYAVLRLSRSLAEDVRRLAG